VLPPEKTKTPVAGPDWLVSVISGCPSPSMSPLMVTLPPDKADNPLILGPESTTIVDPFSAGANWMFHVPGSLFVAMTAS